MFGAIALAVVLAADGGTPVRHFDEELACVAQDGVKFELPKGYYFPLSQFEKMDTEVKRLQAVEKAHRSEPDNLWTIVVGIGIGVLAGAGIALAATKR